MDTSAEQASRPTADVPAGQVEDKPAVSSQEAVDQTLDIKSDHEVSNQEEQIKSLSTVVEQADASNPPDMDTQASKSPDTKADPSLTAGDSTAVGLASGESPSAKPEAQAEKTTEMAETPSQITPSVSQDSDIPTGPSRDAQRSRSESTGGISVKSGGSSASALPENVPRVGGVRCCTLFTPCRCPEICSSLPSTDWAFLKPRYPDPADPKSKFELEFIHLDPVLGAHMRSQSLSMLGRGVIEFIHPEERERECLRPLVASRH